MRIIKMKQPTIWFNAGGKLHHVMRAIREAQQPGEKFRLVCSHHKQVEAATVADVFESEAKALRTTTYREYCLDFARRHAVDVFIPWSYLRTVSLLRPELERLAVRVLTVAQPETMSILQNKRKIYETVGPELAPIPEFRTVQDAATFAEACAGEVSRYVAKVVLGKCVAGVVIKVPQRDRNIRGGRS